MSSYKLKFKNTQPKRVYFIHIKLKMYTINPPISSAVLIYNELI